MANGDNSNGNKPHGNGPWWAGIVLAAGIPLVGSYIAIRSLTEENSNKVQELERRIVQLEIDRARLDDRAEDNRISVIALEAQVAAMPKADNPRINGLELGLAGLGREFARAQETNSERFSNITNIMSELQRLIRSVVELAIDIRQERLEQRRQERGDQP